MRPSFIAAVATAFLAAMTCPTATAISLQGADKKNVIKTEGAFEGAHNQPARDAMDKVAHSDAGLKKRLDDDKKGLTSE